MMMTTLLPKEKYPPNFIPDALTLVSLHLLISVIPARYHPSLVSLRVGVEPAGRTGRGAKTGETNGEAITTP